MKDEMTIYPVRNNLNINSKSNTNTNINTNINPKSDTNNNTNTNINTSSCNILSVTHKYTGKTSIEKAFENIAVNHLKSAKRLDLSAVQR